MSQLIFSWVATWSYYGRCSSEHRWKHWPIFAGRILSEILNNAALIPLHVVGLTSHASFFMQFQMFLIGFASGDCGENSILRIALFLNRHGYVTRSIVFLEHKWVLLVPKHLLYRLQQFPTNEVNVRILVDISINHYQRVNARKLMHLRAITETFLRSRNLIASGFIFYHLFHQHPSLPLWVCKINLHSSESTTKDLLLLVVQRWTFLVHLIWLCRFCYEPWVFFLLLGWICPLRWLTIGPAHHWSDTPLVRHTNSPTHHWSDTPLVRHTIGPTHQ